VQQQDRRAVRRAVLDVGDPQAAVHLDVPGLEREVRQTGEPLLRRPQDLHALTDLSGKGTYTYVFGLKTHV
jgi:hypothetical protein